MIAAFGLGLLGMFAWQATEAPDIAGKWSGPEWGEVVLKQTERRRVRRDVQRHLQGKTGQDRGEMVAAGTPLQRHVARGKGPFRQDFAAAGGR